MKNSCSSHWLRVMITVAQELSRGGLRNLPANLAQRAEEEALDLQARLIGAPRVRFVDGRVVSTQPKRELADR